MDKEAKKLFQGDIWAIDGNRQEIETQSIDHPILRRNGFSIEYSEDAKINREIFNQILCEIIAACKEIIRGIPQWDASITYPADSFVSINGAIYNSISETTGINPINQNQSDWILIGNRVEDPVSVPEKIITTNIFIDGSRSNKFRVFWVPPDDGGRVITGTRLRYSKTSNFSSGVTTINDYTQGTDISIASNDSDAYYVRLMATNSIGDAIESESIKVRTNALVPPAITGITPSTGAASGRVDLSWSSVNPSNGLTISKYRIEWKSGTESFSNSASPARHQETTSTSATITGLTDGTLYTFRVIPVSNRDTENSGTATIAAAPTNSSARPSKPTIAATGGPQIIYASATDLPNNNGSSITSYDWQYKLSSDTDWTSATSTTAPVKTITTTTAGTYNIQMRAVNGVGNSDWSDSVNANVTSTSAPSNITAYIVSGGPGKVVASIGEDTDDGGSAITGYVWQYKLSTDTEWTSATSSINPTKSFNGLTKGSVYNFRITATNSVGTTTSDTINFTIENDVFEEPSDVTASVKSGGPGKVVASIGEDTDDGGSAITGYVWQYKLSTDSNWTSTTSSTNPTQTFTGLTKGSTYNFKVSATNTIGTTTSDAINITIENDDYAVPSNLSVNAFSGEFDGYIKIKAHPNWYSVRQNGAQITGIEWQLRAKHSGWIGNTDWQNWVNYDAIPNDSSAANDVVIENDGIKTLTMDPRISNLNSNVARRYFNALYNNGSYTGNGTIRWEARFRLQNAAGWSNWSSSGALN